ncbi:N-acetylmuramoyl-L-alanine amidase [Roseateles sp. SL47]|jgi:N-acetylmuramoyl-L-alanine amidase|uniref:N-acetylmuramoyl-L-alanine amidase n=1 Tax=Roseateles sp. SL47 TaxID=2995138 RepID=UPI00226DC060|nr:N-acetylmuramoyl-L-alanine amidase [Roseateles sp. SL47]WAC73913.1 N-acetylmuramoyl-L-alanine amidase [Roseateles sp. SL47]
MNIRTRLLTLTAAVFLAACATPTHQIDRTHVSENQDSRVQFLILHYTAIDFDKSLKVLTTGGKVSAHYLVNDNPVKTYQLVDENRRSWHAGVSYWAGATNLNSASIGIEIVNPGFTDTPAGRVYAGYPQQQVDEVIHLVRQIVERHRIRPDRILGHNDIAPGRKQDPGPAFPWKQLADAGLIPWPDAALLDVRRAVFQVVPLPDVAWFQQKLALVGYQTPQTGVMDTATREVLATFQMKYRPSNCAGDMDADTAALLDVVTTPGGMVTLRASPASTDNRSPY